MAKPSLKERIVSDIKAWLQEHAGWRELLVSDQDGQIEFIDRAYREHYSSTRLHRLVGEYPEVMQMPLGTGPIFALSFRDRFWQETWSTIWEWMKSELQSQSQEAS